jgi:hypothetical protein
MNLDLYFSSIFCKWLCLLLDLSSVFVERFHSLGSFKTLRTFAFAWAFYCHCHRCSKLGVPQYAQERILFCVGYLGRWANTIRDFIMLVIIMIIANRHDSLLLADWSLHQLVWQFVYVNHTDSFQLVYDYCNSSSATCVSLSLVLFNSIVPFFLLLCF